MAELMADRVEKLKDLDVFVYHGKIYIPNTYTAGAVGSRFLIELRDNKKIMGTKCPACDMVYVPARSVCKYCFAQLDQWVEVSDTGTLQTYTVAGQRNGVQPVDPPIIYGIIQLDGATHRSRPHAQRGRLREAGHRDEGEGGLQREEGRQHPGHQVLQAVGIGQQKLPVWEKTRNE